MGCRTPALWNSREHRHSGRSHDASLPELAGHISESRGEVEEHSFQDSPRKAHDDLGGNCSDGCFSDFCQIQPHDWAAFVRGWRLRSPGSRTDLEDWLLNNAAPITERRYVLPLVLVTSLFFLWAIGVNINDVLIQHFKKTFGLTDAGSSLIQVAFFGGYCIAALPAGWIMQRLGYKRGILIGLATCATGAVLFIPAASIRLYGFFLFALFVMACGQSVLEVAANPYVTTLGPAESSEQRLNLAQSFNATGAFLVALLGSKFILSGIEYTSAQQAAMSPQELLNYRVWEANMVKTPYLVITGIFLFIAVLIFLTKLPEIQESKAARPGQAYAKLSGALEFPHLLKGVLAQFCYVGAQVGVASFIIRFSEFTLSGTHERAAARFLQAHLFGFMLGRFSGSAMMHKIAASRLLSIFAAGSLLCLTVILLASGMPTIVAIVLLGFF